MNRTAAFLSLAGALGLLALVLATPRAPVSPQPHDPPQPPLVHRPVAQVAPVPHPPEQPGSLVMTGRLSHPVVGVGASDVFVTVDVQGVEVPGQARAAVNLALVIDRSCSMAGEPLRQAKQAAAHLVGQLGDEDRLSIVHYGSEVRALPGMNATAENRARMLAFIRRITDDGGTNISDGLAAGKAQVLRAAGDFKVNRLVLISDGQPTEGLTDERSLLNLSARIRRDGVSISAVGVGTDFNERVMQGVAENGAGAYAYLRDAGMLASIFQRDLQQAGTTVARDVELSFELPAGVELQEVLGYRHTRAGRTIRVPLTDISAGQLERVVARVRVTGQAPGQAVDVAGLKLSYQDLMTERPAESSAALAALTTDRQEEVALRRDKQVAVFAARAQAAANTTAAADLYGAGRRAEGKKLMQRNARVYREAADVAGAEAMAPDLDDHAQVLGAFEAAPAGPALQHQVKDAKAAARKGFGRVGSTY